MCKTHLPKYNFAKGYWMNGHPSTLYTFVDRQTRQFIVRPGERGRHTIGPAIGPECDVRVATRAEAEEKWQNPLNPGWTVED